MPESSISSAVGDDAASAPTLNNIAYDVRVCNFATNPATRVRRLVGIVGDGVAIAEL
jgi:hypothetical protein